MLKEFGSLVMVPVEMTVSVIATVVKRKKILDQKHGTYTFELPLIQFSWLDKYWARQNVATSKRYILIKKVPKLKNIFTFHY